MSTLAYSGASFCIGPSGSFRRQAVAFLPSFLDLVGNFEMVPRADAKKPKLIK